MSDKGWIGVDLDGTLAHYDEVPAGEWDDFKIGPVIQATKERILSVLKLGFEVRIVTARVAFEPTPRNCFSVVTRDEEEYSKRERIAITIQDWLEANGLPRFKVQAHKDYRMLALWDDRAVQFIKNTGQTLAEFYDKLLGEATDLAETVLKEAGLK